MKKKHFSKIFNHKEEKFDTKIKEIIEIFENEKNSVSRRASIRALINDLKKDYLDVHYEAVTDDLTGFLNKKNLDHVFNRQLNLAIRSKQFLSIIVFDMDFLKCINDLYGHAIGTELIKRVANVIKAEIRTTDVACRYGGDEFVLICIHNKKDGVDRVMRRIKKGVNKIRITKGFKPTVSAGIATLKAEQSVTFNIIFAIADNRLYKDKENRPIPPKCVGR